MEILIVVGIVIVLLIILGYSAIPLIVSCLWLIELFAVVCILFFVIMAILVCKAKKTDAMFMRIEPSEKFGEHVIYRIDGKEHPNTFPTDALLGKLLYKGGWVKVRTLQIKDKLLVFDRLSQVIIAIGLPAFCVIAAIMLQYMG